MQINQLPFNIDLLIPTPEMLRGVAQIQALDIFSGGTRNFHPQGLFSTEIFGKVGDERRNRRFAFIDLKTKVFHPVIFKAICDLKQLYAEILSGSSYAKWDNELKDFIKCSPMEGETGFTFFLNHFDEMVFEERESDRREFNIKLVNKYRNNCLMDKLLVLPAGLRDYEVDEQGKPSENEINSDYRKAFSFANLIVPEAVKLNPDSIDSARYNIQLSVVTIFNYIKNLVEGKKKLLLGRWASRRIRNSTRNVITSSIHSIDQLNSPNMVGTNQTVLGLYQYVKSIMPIALHHLRNGFLNKVFIGPNSPAYLVNKKTLKKEMVHVNASYFDEWMTDEGLEKTITRFGEHDLRHLFVEVGNHYLGLIYKGPDGTFKLIQDIDDVPEGRSKKDVRPITFAEILYVNLYQDADQSMGFVTRYPVINYGGIYPSYCYLKTTVHAEIREELDDRWERSGHIAKQFPITGEEFMDSMSPSATHLAALGADFDGDTASWSPVYTDEAKAEIRKKLNSRNFYVGVDNKIHFSARIDTVNDVLSSLTGL